MAVYTNAPSVPCRQEASLTVPQNESKTYEPKGTRSRIPIHDMKFRRQFFIALPLITQTAKRLR